MDKPEISIIVPVYNIALYIGDCIESILSQSFNNFELIIIDDGSSDESLNICRKYQERDSRIIILNGCHHGVGAARNLGLDYARGKYIAFIDGDDLVHPKYLEVLYDKICRFNADIAGVDFKTFASDSKICNETYLGYIQHVEMSLNEIYCNLFQCVRYMVVWGKIYNKEVLVNLKFYLFNLAEDMEFNSRVFQNVKRYIYIAVPLYYYRKRPNSAATSRFNKNQLEGVLAVEKAYNNILETNPDYSHYALIRLYKSIISLYYNSPEIYREDVVKLNKRLRNDTFGAMIRHKKISHGLKLVFILFLKFPYLYKIFIKFMGWKTQMSNRIQLS